MGSSTYDYSIKMFDQQFDEAKELVDYFLGNEFQTNNKFTANLPGTNGFIFNGGNPSFHGL